MSTTFTALRGLGKPAFADRNWHTVLNANADLLDTAPSALFAQTATGTVANTAAETTLASTGVGSLTLPANFLIAGRTIRVTLRGFAGTTGTPTLNIKVKLGSVVICQTAAVATAGTISANSFEVQAILTCRKTGVSGTVIGQGKFWLDNAAQTGLDIGIAAAAAVAVNTTTTQALDVTATWGAVSASNTISCTNLTVEALR